MVYKLHGVKIASEVQLPTSRAVGDKPTFTIEYGSCAPKALPSTAFVQRDSGVRTYSKELTRFDWKWIGRVYVCDGEKIILERSEEYDEFVASIGLSGMACGVLLHQAGHLVLHSSSLSSNGEAILIMGDSGMGKSTLTAELFMKGWRLISDDISCVDINTSKECAVNYGPTFIKLEDVLINRILDEDPKKYPKVFPSSRKRIVPFDGNKIGDSVSLKSVFILNWSKVQEKGGFYIERLSETQAMQECLKHTYALPMMGAFAASREVFKKMSLLSKSVPFYSVEGNRSYEIIDSLEQKIKKLIG